MPGRLSSILCGLLIAPALLSAAQQTNSSTVDDLVRMGIAQNRELLSIRERITEAQGLARQAGVRPIPLLSITGATGRPLGTIGEEEYGASVSQTVETSGKRAKRIEVATFAIGQAEAELQERSASLAYDIRAAVAELRAERQKLKLLDDLSPVNQDALRLTEARVKEGDVAPLEANLLKVEINRSLVLRRSAVGRLAVAETNLKKLTGMSANQPIPALSEDIAKTDDLDAMKRRALEARSDLRAARLLEGQNRAGVDLAKANAKPDLSFNAGYARQYSQFDNVFGQTPTGTSVPIKDRTDVLSFGVSIPLRTSRSSAGDIQAATARASGASLKREFLERTIPLEVEGAYQQLLTAQSSLDLLRSGVVEPSAANLTVIREAYKLGQLRLLDVLNEQRRLVDNELAYIDAQADAARSWAELQRAIGGNLP